MSALSVVDLTHGIAYDHARIMDLSITTYLVDHRGIYVGLFDPMSRKAVRMMKRPEVRYQFVPDKTFSLASYAKDGAAPAVLLTGDLPRAGTKTVHADGSADYRVKEADGSTTFHLDADGVATGVDARSPGLTMTLRFGYGPQHVVRPAPAATISQRELTRGIAYVEMRKIVRQTAHEAAATARHKAHGRTVKVRSVRKAARRAAANINSVFQTPMIKVKNIGRGGKMTATNPWTHQTVTYTVKAHGKKVTVHKK
jgi:hypothetical protein